MDISPIFEDTYKKYLKMLEHIDFPLIAQLLGCEVSHTSLNIPFYDRLFTVNPDGIKDLSGDTVTHAVRIVLCKYVLMCPQTLPEKSSKLATFREFKDAAPLTSHFVTNTNKTIEVAFSGNLQLLKERCLAAGGKKIESSTYDLSIRFFALPRIPVILNFNDTDDIFEANCSILYQASAEHFLDMESLSITGTYLTGRLVSG